MHAQNTFDAICHNAIICVYEELLECELFPFDCALKIVTTRLQSKLRLVIYYIYIFCLQKL